MQSCMCCSSHVVIISIMTMLFSTHHNTVGLSDGPEVDLFVIAAGDKYPARLVAQSQAVDIGAVGHKLLCGETEREGVS